MFRWRCVAPTGNCPETCLDVSFGCSQIEFDPSQNSSSTWGTGCNSRTDTITLLQVAFPNKTCLFHFTNRIVLQSEALQTIFVYEGCVEHIPFKTYDIVSAPRSPFRYKYEFLSINAASSLIVSVVTFWCTGTMLLYLHVTFIH